METLGQRLRAAREAKGLTVSQVAELTRIKSAQVECIEADDFSTIPAVTYGKGFVKLFAQAVGLDSGELVEQYVAAVSTQPTAPQARRSSSASAPVSAPAPLVEPEQYGAPPPQVPEDNAIERTAADRAMDPDTLSLKELGSNGTKRLPLKPLLLMLGAVALLLLLIALLKTCGREPDAVPNEAVLQPLPVIESPRMVAPGYPYLELPEPRP